MLHRVVKHIKPRLSATTLVYPTTPHFLARHTHSSMATHPLLQSFRANKPAFGAWLTIPGPWAARSAAAISPDLSWLLIDCEHGLTSLQPGAAETVAAVAGLGATAPSVLVRIPATGMCADGSAGWQIKYALDAGARGVVVPMVRAQSSHIFFLTHGRGH